MGKSLLSRAASRCRFEAHWRCVEPVVVIESDDWGLQRAPCWDLVAQFGQPTDWALEQTESPADLEALWQVLGRYRDAFDRPACFTANFIVSNPDHTATTATGYAEYIESPIKRTGSTFAAYREGMALRSFHPQYHGLRHLDSQSLLRDLRSGPGGARHLFEKGCSAGLSLAKGNVWRYHSEYLDWSSGAAEEAYIAGVVGSGTSIFERTFGFRPQSTIAPHYVVSRPAFQAWAAAGVKYVQGCNYQIFHGWGGAKEIRSTYLGQPGPHGLLQLGRNVKLEPRPGRRETADRAIAEALQMFAARVPVVIDTHRINYTGRFREAGISGLHEVLEAVAPLNPRYLTTQELGEAIGNQGRYRDIFSGEARQLTPIESKFADVCRLITRSSQAPPTH